MACKKAECRAARGDDRTRFETGYPPENKTRKNHTRSRTVEQLKIRRREIAGSKRTQEQYNTHTRYIYKKEGKRRDAKIASTEE